MGLERAPTLRRNYETLERAPSLRRAMMQVARDSPSDCHVICQKSHVINLVRSCFHNVILRKLCRCVPAIMFTREPV